MVWQTWNNPGQIVLIWFSFSSLSFPEIGWRLVQDFTTAAWRGEVDVVARMLEDGLPVDIRDVGGDTALHNAAEYNHQMLLRSCCLKELIQINEMLMVEQHCTTQHDLIQLVSSSCCYSMVLIGAFWIMKVTHHWKLHVSGITKRRNVCSNCIKEVFPKSTVM